MELIKSKTYLNLAKAYAGECMARNRYEYIEYGARQQGQKALADQLDKLAYNEFNHARMLYSFIQTADNDTIDNIDIASGYPFREKWDLVDNLRLAAIDEQTEAERIYPAYARTAREEGFEDIAALFDNLATIEDKHRCILEDLYQQFLAGKAYTDSTSATWVCSSCGYEAKGKQAFDTCPVCQAKQGTVCLHLEQCL